MSNVDKKIIEKRWDVIVVGTGVGGATVGYSLAKAGKSVLFIEKGGAAPNLFGRYAEEDFPTESVPRPEHQEILARAGRYSETIRDVSSDRPRDFIPLTGSGVGGSSALYGMAFERLIPSDFLPKRTHPNAVGSSAPDAWPITYDELAPYYAQAEALYRVKGEVCPLRGAMAAPLAMPVRPMNPASEEISGVLRARGMHPYRLPLASDFAPNCTLCQGYLCDKACKNDSRRICLEPALAEHGAMLLDRCEVVRMEATSQRVTGVRCMRDGEEFSLHGEQVILAAGAIETARLLLLSCSQDWPDGLANRSGLVGKNLMRHQIDLIAVEPKCGTGSSLPTKDIGINDFYFAETKLGAVQSFGDFPSESMMLATVWDDLEHSRVKFLVPLIRLVRPILRHVVARMRKRSLILVAMLEDLPYESNAVTLPPLDMAGVRMLMHYRVHEYEKRRSVMFRKHIQSMLKGYKVTFIKQATNNRLVAHGCGTCRFGDDPKTSVLDRNNKAHGVDNLYVVDASFFPTSGGTNPSLTIAANALRVAERMLQVERT